MKKVIVHCSDSPFGNAELIGSWHRARGWNEIGYNFVILNGRPDSKFPYDSFYDGIIETGRHFKETGAHTRGQNDAIGICLIGNSNEFTQTQLNKLDQLLIILKERYGELNINQHSYYDPKNKPFCAGFSDEYIKKLKRFE